MKVLMVGPYPAPGRPVTGGVERVIDTLLPALATRVELTLVVPGAERNEEVFARGARIVYLKRTVGFGFINYWIFDGRRIRDIAREISADVVHLQGAGGWGLLVDRPKVMTVHGISHRDILSSNRNGRFSAVLRRIAASVVKEVERRARRFIGNLIIISPYVFDEYPDALLCRSWQIANPLDSRFVDTPQVDSGSRKDAIVVIGKVGSRKNTLEAVRIACAVLREVPDATLLVAGDISDREYVERCKSVTRDFEVESRIRFLGNLSTPDLVRVLDESSVMLMTSRQETAPMAIIEALSRGVPCVAPDSFGIRTMIESGKNGFFIQEGDIQNSVYVLRNALSRNWDRGGIASVARHKYSVDAVSTQIVKVYGEVSVGSDGESGI